MRPGSPPLHRHHPVLEHGTTTPCVYLRPVVASHSSRRCASESISSSASIPKQWPPLPCRTSSSRRSGAAAHALGSKIGLVVAGIVLSYSLKRSAKSKLSISPLNDIQQQVDKLTADSPMENKRTARSKPKANQKDTSANIHQHVNAHNQVNAPNAYQATPQFARKVIACAYELYAMDWIVIQNSFD
ncbi:Transcription factor VOZ1 [Zea mays]|uniref:Transcription factor VOZ1 n=1 Tax=Zea mays TaxID=4577 RepID=A0A1D6E7L5_MAIZE|nr:Transcription factor VOZ1 [Zea mays]